MIEIPWDGALRTTLHRRGRNWGWEGINVCGMALIISEMAFQSFGIRYPRGHSLSLNISLGVNL